MAVRLNVCVGTLKQRYIQYLYAFNLFHSSMLQSLLCGMQKITKGLIAYGENGQLDHNVVVYCCLSPIALFWLVLRKNQRTQLSITFLSTTLEIVFATIKSNRRKWNSIFQFNINIRKMTLKSMKFHGKLQKTNDSRMNLSDPHVCSSFANAIMIVMLERWSIKEERNRNRTGNSSSM